MFVADNVTGRPPVSDIWMIRFRNEDFAKSALMLGIIGIVKMQHVHFLEIEGERTAAAVDFESELILAAAGEACGFQI